MNGRKKTGKNTNVNQTMSIGFYIIWPCPFIYQHSKIKIFNDFSLILETELGKTSFLVIAVAISSVLILIYLFRPLKKVTKRLQKSII